MTEEKTRRGQTITLVQFTCAMWLICLALTSVYAAKYCMDLLGWTDVIHAYQETRLG